MHLGVSSYTFTWAVGVAGQRPEKLLTVLDLLDKAVQLGVRVVQICDNLPLHQLSTTELDDLAARAGGLGLQIEVGTRGIGLDHLCTYLQLAERLKSPILRVVIDTADEHPSEEQIIQRIRALAPELERAGVCLAIENHDRFTAKTLVSILERIASPQVRICLDTGNSFGALEGPEIVVQTLGPWAVNLHMKDYVVQRAANMMGFVIQGRAAGQGQLNIPWVLQELRRLNRDPNAILELWTPPEPTLVATINKEATWAEASIRYLRTFITD